MIPGNLSSQLDIMSTGPDLHPNTAQTGHANDHHTVASGSVSRDSSMQATCMYAQPVAFHSSRLCALLPLDETPPQGRPLCEASAQAEHLHRTVPEQPTPFLRSQLDTLLPVYVVPSQCTPYHLIR